ncbi:MAG: hypothetical protein Ct9H300mP12_01250 [Acidimicrobiales bacterium]|nr:MAG: hypothetical protein Ct9H300mP12_01250 [Acidimicrobiales bacterium]
MGDGPATVLELALERSGYLESYGLTVPSRPRGVWRISPSWGLGFSGDFDTVDEFLERVGPGSRHRRPT